MPPTSKPHTVSVSGLTPTLVVSTTHDPATPYQAGVDLSSQLKGGLLTYDGTQHTVVFQGNSCIDDYATAYLVSGTVPYAMLHGTGAFASWVTLDVNSGTPLSAKECLAGRAHSIS